MSFVDIFRDTQAGKTEPKLSADDLLSMLSNARRRRTIWLLDADNYSKSDLAERLTEFETMGRYDSSDRKKVYVGMHQVHLPKLEDVGIIELERDIVRAGPAHGTALAALEAISPYVDDIEDADRRTAGGSGE